MEHCKLQLGCLFILIYIGVIYLKECKECHHDLKNTFFDEIYTIGIISVILDGITAYTVNNTDLVNHIFNLVLHGLFYISIDTVIFAMFLYMTKITDTFPKKRQYKIIVFAPFVINIILVFANLGSVEFVQGNTTFYSRGFSAYTCFITAGIYFLMSLAVFVKGWRYIATGKRTSLFTYLFALVLVAVIQMAFPETLLSCIAVTVFIIGLYMNQEDPHLHTLSEYHRETVMSFANLVENRDGNTGGHIKRTSRYVRLIADELYSHRYYDDVLTSDYINDLVKAAPMHDIGKIGVPDAVLRKPGRLTDEEYEQMKLHAAKGGDIIRESFRNLGNEDYRRMAFEVARYHHEKWNGKGYPDGLKRKDIPLSARIMAVADVFDAISENRCYREAMPMDKCFEIIAQGSGQDFDPIIAEVFIEARPKVEAIHKELSENKS